MALREGRGAGGGGLNEDKTRGRKTKRRIYTDGQTATTSTTNKQTAQQSEIPLTLAQIEDTRSQTQESKMDNLPTL